jgi:hypothetical protein
MTTLLPEPGSVDQSKTAFAQMCLFDAPAEVLDLRRHIERLDRHLRGERVVFEAIQSEELLIHGFVSSVIGG